MSISLSRIISQNSSTNPNPPLPYLLRIWYEIRRSYLPNYFLQIFNKSQFSSGLSISWSMQKHWSRLRSDQLRRASECLSLESVESRNPWSQWSRTTIRCLAVVISRIVVASYDGNTGNATLIHPGQAERPLHRELLPALPLFSLLRQWSIVKKRKKK